MSLDDRLENDHISVEICKKLSSSLSKNELIQSIQKYVIEHDFSAKLSTSLLSDDYLKEHVQDLSFYDSKENCLHVIEPHQLEKHNLSFYVYCLHQSLAEEEMLDDDAEDLPAANHLMLPSQIIHNVWETLIYDTDIKETLLSYALTGLLFAEKGVNQSVITWNRIILLHGPPGTGKTSLCHALAHKLSVRLCDRFSSASLLEINSHSLFSKWFSESGKLVMKMFKKVEELIEDEHHLVCLLIDEVESLTAARSAVESGTEPSDAIRVVNALLTQIDRLKKFKNVLILTTSNVTGKIDLAFVDRADIKFFVGLPSPVAIYSIFRSCLEELARVRIIRPKEAIERDPTDLGTTSGLISEHGQRLWKIANKSVGLSGRTLRKLPFLAHARFAHTTDSVTLGCFLDILSKAVEVQFSERNELSDL